MNLFCRNSQKTYTLTNNVVFFFLVLAFLLKSSCEFCRIPCSCTCRHGLSHLSLSENESVLQKLTENLYFNEQCSCFSCLIFLFYWNSTCKFCRIPSSCTCRHGFSYLSLSKNESVLQKLTENLYFNEQCSVFSCLILLFYWNSTCKFCRIPCSCTCRHGLSHLSLSENESVLQKLTENLYFNEECSFFLVSFCFSIEIPL